MLDAWKDCEVLNTHEGQIICLTGSSSRTRTLSADSFPRTSADNAEKGVLNVRSEVPRWSLRSTS